MSKSFKFKNNQYLDSSGITHNKETLNEVIEFLKSEIEKKMSSKMKAKVLNTVKWYRIANLGNATGKSKAMIVELCSIYNSTPNASFLIAVNIVHQKAKIAVLNGIANNKNVFTKVRIVEDVDKNMYLEFYYNLSSGRNEVKVAILEQIEPVEMLDFEDTTNTVTVYSELDLASTI